MSDLFLRLSEEPRLLLPRWTDEIWDEVRRTWVGQLDWPVEIADRRIAAATDCFPEALIRGYERFLPLCENHPKDVMFLRLRFLLAQRRLSRSTCATIRRRL